ncbi:MAG: hypothetical protein ACOY82_03650 [Pseudomonadota bacterium]
MSMVHSMPRPLLSLALFAAVALSPLSALAQKPIEQDMTPEEFKAAGLDKLSPEELARLNAWLGRKIDTVSTEAAAQAKDKVEQENRGFFHFGSSEPIVSRITGEFRGFAMGRTYTLENGQVWRQTDGASLVGAKLTDPEVRINPSISGNAWYLAVKGFNTRAKVERVK